MKRMIDESLVSAPHGSSVIKNVISSLEKYSFKSTLAFNLYAAPYAGVIFVAITYH